MNRTEIKKGMKVWVIGSNYKCYELEVDAIVGNEVKAGQGWFDFDELYPSEQAALQAVIDDANEFMAEGIWFKKSQDIKKQAELRLEALNETKP